MSHNLWSAQGWPFVESRTSKTLNGLGGEVKLKYLEGQVENFMKGPGNLDDAFLLTLPFPSERRKWAGGPMERAIW